MKQIHKAERKREKEEQRIKEVTTQNEKERGNKKIAHKEREYFIPLLARGRPVHVGDQRWCLAARKSYVRSPLAVEAESYSALAEHSGPQNIVLSFLEFNLNGENELNEIMINWELAFKPTV